jgi:hypothetical protein
MDQLVRRQRRVAELVRLLGASTTLIPPKVLEPVGSHFGVSDRVLDVLVAEIVLQGPRVVAIVREFEPAGMAKHVRVDREWHLGGLPEALDEPVETDGTSDADRVAVDDLELTRFDGRSRGGEGENKGKKASN